MRLLELETTWGRLRLVGGSRAGEATMLLLPQLRLALDAGRPARALVAMRHVVASHGHLDHVLGIPAWASQRQLQGLPPADLYAPPSLVPRLERLLALAAEMEGGEPYPVRVHDVAPGSRVELRADIALHFFRTSHWVETLGTCVEWSRTRLRADLAGLLPEAVRERRLAGEQVTEVTTTPLLAYLSDTGPQVFETERWLADVEVLVVECTFLRAADRDRATRYGHIHLADLVDVAPRLRCRHLVLTHLSRRQRLAAGATTMRRALRPVFGGGLHTLNVEWE